MTTSTDVGLKEVQRDLDSELFLFPYEYETMLFGHAVSSGQPNPLCGRLFPFFL